MLPMGSPSLAEVSFVYLGFLNDFKISSRLFIPVLLASAQRGLTLSSQSHQPGNVTPVRASTRIVTRRPLGQKVQRSGDLSVLSEVSDSP